jgi:WD40 repeat protein
MLDDRINKNNKVAKIKQYKTNPDFNCIISTITGETAIGSNDGTIRLYDDLSKKAKTLLSCYGDSIRAIDVSKDGSYILATCDKYLMVINTVNDNDDTNGFKKPLGKSKHSPKTLKISPQDIVKYGLENDKFTPAKFNISKNDKESNITTSIGEYIVIWNFNKIKKGIVNQYKIKKVNDFVIENTYKYNKNQVIVTMPNKLRVQNQKYNEYE